MTQPAVKPASPVTAHPVRSAVIAVLVAGLIIGTLYVPFYDSTTPKVGDFPFFYFYLLLYFPVIAVVLWIVVLLQRGMRTDAEGGGSAEASTASEVTR
jgi:hypothetical protein